MAKAKKEEKPALERTYTIPLRREVLKAPRYKRAKKAVKTIRTFLVKHMKIRERDLSKIKLDPWLNRTLWIRSIRKPPHKITVKATKDAEGTVKAEFVGLPAKYKVEEAMILRKKAKQEKRTAAKAKVKKAKAEEEKKKKEKEAEAKKTEDEKKKEEEKKAEKKGEEKKKEEPKEEKKEEEKEAEKKGEEEKKEEEKKEAKKEKTEEEKAEEEKRKEKEKALHKESAAKPKSEDIRAKHIHPDGKKEKQVMFRKTLEK